MLKGPPLNVDVTTNADRVGAFRPTGVMQTHVCGRSISRHVSAQKGFNIPATDASVLLQSTRCTENSRSERSNANTYRSNRSFKGLIVPCGGQICSKRAGIEAPHARRDKSKRKTRQKR